jgi:hypothetical protein
MLFGTKWVWVSMASAKADFLVFCRAPHDALAPIIAAKNVDVTLQAGWTVFIMDAIEE